jgi:hypothetical protein
MPDVWRIYHIRNCPHTYPILKDKFVAIVCRDIEFMGFFINTTINQFIQKRPALLACQVIIQVSDYGFLSHNSYIDCSKLYPFEDVKLVDGRELINNQTKADIKRVISISKTIEKCYLKLILGNC